MKKILVPILALVSIILCAVVVIIMVNKKEIKWGDSTSKQIEFTYTVNGGVPYKWEYKIEDESIVSFVKSYVIEDKNVDGLVGAPISTNYVFKGLKEGITTVTFKYISLAENERVVRSEKHLLKVDKDGNIALQAID